MMDVLYLQFNENHSKSLDKKDGPFSAQNLSTSLYFQECFIIPTNYIDNISNLFFSLLYMKLG